MVMNFKAGQELAAADLFSYGASTDCSADGNERGYEVQVVCFHVQDQLHGLVLIFWACSVTILIVKFNLMLECALGSLCASFCCY
jgi:hypothetical protein